MGSVSKVFKKVTKAVTKPVSKAFKSVAKGIMKVGKATMRGISKVSAKLGPIGSIALAIAMPYALGGLSTLVGTPAMAGMGGSGLMGSTNVFLRSIGTVGNAIRTGYGAINSTIAGAKGALGNKLGGMGTSITKSISKGFQKFAPHGVKDMYSAISKGAKSLYTSAKTQVSKLKPLQAKEGTIEYFGDDGVQLLKSSDAANLIEKNALDVSRLGEQTLSGKGGFLTKVNAAGVKSDNLITDTINGAYEERLKGFSTSAKRMYDDTLAKSIELGTYTNNEQVGALVENSIGTTQNRFYGGPDKLFVDTDTNLLQTGDYTALNEKGDEFLYNGNKTFAADPVKQASISSTAKKAIGKTVSDFGKSLLKPSEKLPVSYNVPTTQDMTMQTSMSGYGGTNIIGAGGGTLFQSVYGDAATNNLTNFYRNMNLLTP